MAARKATKARGKHSPKEPKRRETREFMRSLRGSLKGTPSILNKLLEERRREGR